LKLQSEPFRELVLLASGVHDEMLGAIRKARAERVAVLVKSLKPRNLKIGNLTSLMHSALGFNHACSGLRR
jgi:hypothetical protein